VLLLDEPTRSLDPPTQTAVRRFIRERLAGGGSTVVMVTHSTAEAADVCDRAVIIDRGRIARVTAAAALSPSDVVAAQDGR
jgi:ABC-type multidrug transport system ATPase subunit